MRLIDDFFKVNNHTETDGKHEFAISLNADHFIFKAHFPGNPIVPGVCQMQIVKELMEIVAERQLEIKSVKNIKYLTVLSPNETCDLNIVLQKISIDGDAVKASATFLTEEKTYTKLSMQFV